MNISEHATKFSRPRSRSRIFVFLLALALVFATLPQHLWAEQDQGAAQGAPAQASPDQGAPDQSTNQSATIQSPPAPGQAAAAPAYTQQTPEQLQQLVAPIA